MGWGNYLLTLVSLRTKFAEQFGETLSSRFKGSEVSDAAAMVYDWNTKQAIILELDAVSEYKMSSGICFQECILGVFQTFWVGSSDTFLLWFAYNSSGRSQRKFFSLSEECLFSLSGRESLDLTHRHNKVQQALLYSTASGSSCFTQASDCSVFLQ